MKKLTKEQVINKLSTNNSNIILLSDYTVDTTSRTKLKFKCLICQNEWNGNLGRIINARNGCPKCGKQISKNTKKYDISTEDFHKKIDKIFNNKIKVIGEYVNCFSEVQMKCNICDYEWLSTPTYLIKKHGCIKCGHIEKGKKQRKSNETFINEINIKHDGRINTLEEYKTGRDRIKVKCNICDYEWSPISRTLTRRGCPKCNFSKGELLISKILKELNTDFIEQYIFTGLKTDNNGIPIFDFVIFENSIIRKIIEYDGEQHFKVIKKWGGIKRFDRQQKIDKFKNDYCKNNNIEMIRIPYTELKKINIEYIKEILWKK